MRAAAIELRAINLQGQLTANDIEGWAGRIEVANVPEPSAVTAVAAELNRIASEKADSDKVEIYRQTLALWASRLMGAVY